jgi:hypothetical protein
MLHLSLKPEVVRAEIGGDGEPTTAKGNTGFDREPMPAIEKPQPRGKLNGNRMPKHCATVQKDRFNT